MPGPGQQDLRQGGGGRHWVAPGENISIKKNISLLKTFQSGQPLHSMRDHPFHTTPLLGRVETGDLSLVQIYWDTALWLVGIMMLLRQLTYVLSHKDEAWAVSLWHTQINDPAHGMRSSSLHSSSRGSLGCEDDWAEDQAEVGPVLAGHSAGKNISTRENIWLLEIFEDPESRAGRERKGPDQTLLARWVWRPWGREAVLEHDSYT